MTKVAYLQAWCQKPLQAHTQQHADTDTGNVVPIVWYERVWRNTTGAAPQLYLQWPSCQAHDWCCRTRLGTNTSNKPHGLGWIPMPRSVADTFLPSGSFLPAALPGGAAALTCKLCCCLPVSYTSSSNTSIFPAGISSALCTVAADWPGLQLPSLNSL